MASYFLLVGPVRFLLGNFLSLQYRRGILDVRRRLMAKLQQHLSLDELPGNDKVILDIGSEDGDGLSFYPPCTKLILVEDLHPRRKERLEKYRPLFAGLEKEDFSVFLNQKQSLIKRSSRHPQLLMQLDRVLITGGKLYLVEYCPHGRLPVTYHLIGQWLLLPWLRATGLSPLEPDFMDRLTREDDRYRQPPRLVSFPSRWRLLSGFTLFEMTKPHCKRLCPSMAEQGHCDQGDIEEHRELYEGCHRYVQDLRMSGSVPDLDWSDTELENEFSLENLQS